MHNVFKRLTVAAGALCVLGTCSTAFAQDNSFVQGDSSVTIDAAKRRAAASPMPEEAPVMIAVFI